MADVQAEDVVAYRVEFLGYTSLLPSENESTNYLAVTNYAAQKQKDFLPDENKKEGVYVTEKDKYSNSGYVVVMASPGLSPEDIDLLAEQQLLQWALENHPNLSYTGNGHINDAYPDSCVNKKIWLAITGRESPESMYMKEGAALLHTLWHNKEDITAINTLVEKNAYIRESAALLRTLQYIEEELQKETAQEDIYEKANALFNRLATGQSMLEKTGRIQGPQRPEGRVLGK